MKQNPEGARSRAFRILWMAVADALVFAALLLTFAYFHHVRVDRLEPTALLTPPAQLTATPKPTTPPASSSSAPETTPEETAATPEPVAVIENDLLQGKYADRFTSGEVIADENGYRSAYVSLTLNRVQSETLTYIVADIYVRDLSCLRTAVALEYSDQWMSVRDMAAASDAIVAISGDYFGFRKSNNVAVRNGKQWVRKRPIENDICVMYYDGTVETVLDNSVDLDAIYARSPYQIWCFGPALLDENGVARERFENTRVTKANPRSSFGYFEPGHYCFITVDGRQKGYSLGITLRDLARLYQELGCKAAYNLDGGETVVMVYRGEVVNQPEEGGPRDVSDIIYVGEPVSLG